MNLKLPDGVKPRFDGKGSEFGELHRLLGKELCMFDIDMMSAKAVLDLELNNQDIGFIEYRIKDWDSGEITFTALFEIKYKDSFFVRKALENGKGTSTFAQIAMAKKLGCRYFFVISNEGKQPFELYEYNFGNDKFNNPIMINYDTDNYESKICSIIRTWVNLNLL